MFRTTSHNNTLVETLKILVKIMIHCVIWQITHNSVSVIFMLFCNKAHQIKMLLFTMFLMCFGMPRIKVFYICKPLLLIITTEFFLHHLPDL